MRHWWHRRSNTLSTRATTVVRAVDVHQLLDPPLTVRPRGPWWAIGRSLLFATGLGLAWFAVAPPRPLSAMWCVLGLTITGVAAAATLVPAMNGSVRSWPMLSLSIVMAVMLPTWFVVHPGFRPAWLVFLVILAIALGLATVFAGSVARSGDHLADSLSAVVITLAALALLAYSGSELRQDGRRWRLDLVRDDYEAAIAAGTVAASGGFVEGDLSGWVWSETTVHPLYAVVFDETNRLDRVTRISEVVVDEFDIQMICDPIEPMWFWCTFALIGRDHMRMRAFVGS